MKWLLVVGIIAIIFNASETLAKHSKEHEDSKNSSSDSSDDNSSQDSSQDSKDSSSESSESSNSSGNHRKPGIIRPPQRSWESSPVKVLKVSPLNVNKEYFCSKGSIQVIRVNETYNALKIDLKVTKDLPATTKVVVKMFGSLSRDGGFHVIGRTYSFGLTETTNKYHELLPRELIEHIKKSNGLAKGRYTSEDFGYFKFYKLLSREQLSYPYYKVIYNYENEGVVLLSLDYRFQLLTVKSQTC